MTIPMCMLLGYLVVTFCVGLTSSKHSKNTKEFFIAEKNLTTPLIITMLFSELIAGAGTIGNAAIAFRQGLNSVWANWGMALGCVLFVLLVAKFFRAMGCVRGAISTPEAYAALFDNRSRIVMLFNITIVYFILYSTQAVAAAAILTPLFGENETLITWLITALFIGATLFGGMKGIAKMNAVHALVMFIGMLIVALKSLQSVGGISGLHEALPISYFSFIQPDLPTVIAQVIGTAIGFLASANVVSATFSAKSFSSVRRGVSIAGLLVVPFALMPAVIGLCARITLPEIQANNALFAMANNLGGVYGGLVSMAIIAAIFSTAPALLLIVCTTLTKDLYKGFIHKQGSEQQQMWFSRLMAILIGIAGTLFGRHAGPIMNQMLGAFQIRSVVGLILVIALYWPRVTKDAAFYSMLVGGIVASIWHFTGNPFQLAPLWPSIAVALIILVVLTIRNKGKESAGYKAYLDALQEFNELEDCE